MQSLHLSQNYFDQLSKSITEDVKRNSGINCYLRVIDIYQNLCSRRTVIKIFIVLFSSTIRHCSVPICNPFPDLKSLFPNLKSLWPNLKSLELPLFVIPLDQVCSHWNRPRFVIPLLRSFVIPKIYPNIWPLFHFYKPFDK